MEVGGSPKDIRPAQETWGMGRNLLERVGTGARLPGIPDELLGNADAFLENVVVGPEEPGILKAYLGTLEAYLRKTADCPRH